MTSQKVVRSYLIIAGLYTLSASLIWGINTLFLLDAGLDILGVFIANTAFTAGQVLFEIPTGVLADTSGRRTSFLLSVVVLFLGTLGYVAVAAMGGSLALFIVVSILLGLGYTFYSGAVEAWLVDALNATDYEGELDHVFARGAMVTGATMLVGTVAGGVLGNLDLAVPFIVRGGLLAAVFGVAYFTMHDIGFSPRALQLAAIPAEMGQIARASITYGWQQQPIRLMMLVAFLQMGVVTWGFHAWQPYLLDLLGQEDAVWVAGVVAALIALATIGGNGLVEWATRFCGRRTTLLLAAAGTLSLAIIGVGLTGSFWVAVILLLLAMGALGIIGPTRQAYLHRLIPSEQRATVISFDSMIGNGGGILSQSGLGYLAQTRSIAGGYVIGGLATLLGVPILLAIRRLGGSADIIVGKAGVASACAAQGLPEGAHVDTKRRRARNLEAGTTAV